MARVDLSIIIACYNEGITFRQSVEKIINVLKTLKKNWEIIFVEDKSLDETAQTVKKLIDSIKNSRLRLVNSDFGGQAQVIFHKKNMGRGKSVSDGIKSSRGSICGYLDVDLEVSADYIPLFVNEVDKGFDMVVGKRFYESNFKAITRVAASKIYAFVVRNFLKVPIEDTEAGYKFFKRSKIMPILSRVRDKHWFWDTEICARSFWMGLKISQIPVFFVRRSDKKSTVRLLPDTLAYLTKIIKFRREMPRTSVNG